MKPVIIFLIFYALIALALGLDDGRQASGIVSGDAPALFFEYEP